MSNLIVVFERLDQVEPWYECPGRYAPDPAQPGRLRYVPGSSCGFRAPWEDPAWCRDASGDRWCPCGAAPPLTPVGCNWQVVCTPECEHHGCDLSDCVTDARTHSTCPYGCPAVLREVKAEPISAGVPATPPRVEPLRPAA